MQNIIPYFSFWLRQDVTWMCLHDIHFIHSNEYSVYVNINVYPLIRYIYISERAL